MPKKIQDNVPDIDNAGLYKTIETIQKTIQTIQTPQNLRAWSDKFYRSMYGIILTFVLKGTIKGRRPCCPRLFVLDYTELTY